jgi:hypothetical protein
MKPVWAFLILSVAVALQDEAPWGTDAAAARRRALEDGKPCVLILNVDARAH